MFRILLLTLFTTSLLVAAGCGDDSRQKSAADQTEDIPPPLAQGAATIAAALDVGHRAAQTLRLDPALAARGEVLFEEKACSGCHTLGDADDAPDLRDVTSRRTEAWLRKQIIDPEWMNQYDPITRQLVAEYEVEMTDVDATEAEATALIHYLLREGTDSHE